MFIHTLWESKARHTFNPTSTLTSWVFVEMRRRGLSYVSIWDINMTQFMLCSFTQLRGNEFGSRIAIGIFNIAMEVSMQISRARKSV